MKTGHWQVTIQCEQVVEDSELHADDLEERPAGPDGKGSTKDYEMEVYALNEEDAEWKALDRFHADCPIADLEAFVNPPIRVLRIVELDEGEECIIRSPAHDFRVSVSNGIDSPNPGMMAVHTDSDWRYWQGDGDGVVSAISRDAYLSDAR